MKYKKIPIIQIADDLWEVLETTEINVFGGKIVIPQGFQCDMASIPKAFQWVIPKRGREIDVSLIHDFLYSKYSPYDINRKEADYIFYTLMKNGGMCSEKAAIIYRAVRLFGESHFDKPKLNGHTPCEKIAFVDKRKEWKEHLKRLKRDFPQLYSTLY